MKSKLMAALAIIVMVMVAGACAKGAEANKDIDVVVPMEEFAGAKNVQTQVELEKGDILNVILGSNPSTGYSWTETAVVSSAGILKQDSHTYVEPGKTSVPVVGAAGHERWTFTALEAGTTRVNLKYSRPWEKDTAPEWTFELTVNVK